MRNGQLTWEEVPRLVVLRLSRRPGKTITDKRLSSAESPRAAPRWFDRMDRNGDGDVSPRESLGLLDAFRRLDANGGQLLGAAEAAAAR
ncbi:MAG TPA: hypothetical protein VHZ24_19975 [Pirellulales bacterium]|nr:hypothetical protein [Pirellulales bacterium]